MEHKIKSSSGRRYNLTGYKVSQLRLCTTGYPVRLILEGPNGIIVELSFAGKLKLTHYSDSYELTGSLPGPTFNPTSLGIIANLLGSAIDQININTRYELLIICSNGWNLEAGLDEYDYPIWTLRENASLI